MRQTVSLTDLDLETTLQTFGLLSLKHLLLFKQKEWCKQKDEEVTSLGFKINQEELHPSLDGKQNMNRFRQ